MKLLILFITLLPVAALAQRGEHVSIHLTNGHAAYVVPAGRVWKIERLSPCESERGVGTSDFYIEGAAQIGENRGYNLNGKFEITLSANQPSPLWLLAGSKITMGDSRGKVVVQEYPDR